MPFGFGGGDGGGGGGSRGSRGICYNRQVISTLLLSSSNPAHHHHYQKIYIHCVQKKTRPKCLYTTLQNLKCSLWKELRIHT